MKKSIPLFNYLDVIIQRKITQKDEQCQYIRQELVPLYNQVYNIYNEEQ